MDTSSVNKLNRYRATLDAIVAKDYNENHGPDGRFESGPSSAGSKENKAAKEQIFKAATKGARKTAAAKKKKEKSEARRTLKNLEKESQQSREDRIKAYMKETGASREKAENYVAKEDIFRSATKSFAESKLAKDYNENHNPDNGRFTSGGSGSSSSSSAASKTPKHEALVNEANKGRKIKLKLRQDDTSFNDVYTAEDGRGASVNVILDKNSVKWVGMKNGKRLKKLEYDNDEASMKTCIEKALNWING